jgi:tRNA(Arg) A34 adenosine deaminase TadA
MMTLAIELSRRNVKEGTGGPFGAAIFERIIIGTTTNNSNTKSTTTTPPILEEEEDYCRLVSVGMNRVVPLNNSTLHGEMVAIQLAQHQLQTFSLNGEQQQKLQFGNNNNNNNTSRQYELFTSCEPCAMCLGGILWSGVSRLVCGATKDDAQSIGFDEGPVTSQSYVHLQQSGCVVVRNVLRNEAREVLYNYGKTGVIYNGSVRSGGHLLPIRTQLDES